MTQAKRRVEAVLKKRARLFRPFDPQTYERSTFSNVGGEIISQRELSSISELLRATGDETLLEIGVGTGRVFQKIAQQSMFSVGLDVDKNMVYHTAAKMRNSKTKREILHFLVADGEHLPFRPHSFTRVICVRALKYCRNTKRAIHEMCSVMSPEGRVVLEFPNILGPSALFQLPQFMTLGRPFPRLFTLKSISREMTANSLAIEQVVGWHKLPPGAMVLTNNRLMIRSLTILEQILQIITPIEFLSRSLVVAGRKLSISRIRWKA